MKRKSKIPALFRLLDNIFAMCKDTTSLRIDNRFFNEFWDEFNSDLYNEFLEEMVSDEVLYTIGSIENLRYFDHKCHVVLARDDDGDLEDVTIYYRYHLINISTGSKTLEVIRLPERMYNSIVTFQENLHGFISDFNDEEDFLFDDDDDDDDDDD